MDANFDNLALVVTLSNSTENYKIIYVFWLNLYGPHFDIFPLIWLPGLML